MIPLGILLSVSNGGQDVELSADNSVASNAVLRWYCENETKIGKEQG